MAGFDIGALLADPNFQQGLGNAGAALSSGASVGEALNPSDMIAQKASQQGGAEMLRRILAGQQGGPTSQLGSTGNVVPQAPTGQVPPNVTPVGFEGLDKHTVVTNPDGQITTTTVDSPNRPAAALPQENQTAAGGGQGQSPFFKTLFQ